MATIIWTGSTVNDTIRFATYGQPSSTNTYTLDALAGTDTLDMVAGNQYASKFISTNFTIGTADSNGMIVVTGASSGGKDHFTFNLKSVESIKFSDTTVQPLTVLRYLRLTQHHRQYLRIVQRLERLALE